MISIQNKIMLSGLAAVTDMLVFLVSFCVVDSRGR